MESQVLPSAFLFVKNTFIDVPDAPPPKHLLRASTMPATTMDSEDSEDDSENEHEETLAPSDTQLPVEAAQANQASESKMITCDGYEPTQEWLWTGPEMPPEADWVVKNTFLELKPNPDLLGEPPTLIRHKSAPAQTLSKQNNSNNEEEPSSAGYTAQSDAELPPHAPLLERVTTLNDDNYNYDWCATGPGMPPADQMSMQTQMPMSMALPTSDVSMMMLPVTYVIQEGPQGESIMVPVGRFGAFPEAAISQPGFGGQSCPPEHPDPAFEKPAVDKPPATPVDKPPVLQRHQSVSTQLFRFRWNIEEGQLKKSDREKVSPPLEMDVGGVKCSFKLIVKPKEISESRGGRSFKKAKGKGTIDVICTDQPDDGINMKFVVAVGKSGSSSFTDQSTAIDHDFSSRHICSVPKEFDFQAAVDEMLQQFCVSLQVMARPVC
eukprot:TRINITY_DN87394_c0_g1_i1.p1 TRINITY_DN87394_c0_g1~~TRINITY_DN87394_c0_g1_i1.p1  ORF type:complete len:436 (-),score=66.85 TRINITY_DN87394_c0_g1_i1:22-1329(-)